MGYGFGGWAPYVSVAERRRQASKKIAAMTKKGEKVAPVVIVGRVIATTFWGKAWCDNLESYMDYENRLPRGRTYVRNGSVVDLKIAPGKINALVSGSSLYSVEINIKPVDKARWQGVIKSCSGQIDSLVELLQGKLSRAVMAAVTSTDKGLFPAPQQISLKCSCPDSATMCKHVAATLYGVGSRLDNEPELLFLLRQVDHLELIAKASMPAAGAKTTATTGRQLKTKDLGSIFGIEIDVGQPAPSLSKRKSDKATVKKSKKALPKKAAAVRGKKKAAATKPTVKRAKTKEGKTKVS